MASDALTIRIEGVGPYGFRLFGGDGDPLVIAKLRKRSKAWDAGLEEGDVLVSINDHPCRNISHAAAMNLVDNSGHYLNLKVLRKGGVTGQLQVTRTGSRQRSLTPSTAPPVQFKASPSPEPPRVVSTQSFQWSSRVTADIHQPTVSQRQQRTFQIHLSESETERPADETWNRPSKPGFLGDRNAKQQHSRSPSNETPRFSPVPSPQTKPAVTQIKSPAVWKPPSWQPPSTEPSRTTFSQEISVTRFNTSTQNDSMENAPAVWKPPSWQTESSRTTCPLQENHAATPQFNSKYSKENVPPAVNRNTPSFQANQVEVAKHKPNVWQPSGVSQVKKTFPVQSASPAVDSGHEFDLIDGGGRGDNLKQPKWNDALADGFGQRLNDLPPHLNKILSANFANDEENDSILHEKEKKKVFVDSSFYNDPAHSYPTVDEQIRMARQVAMSLTAPSNVKARGHRMFMKRKEKSDKWVVETPGLERNIRGSDTEADIYYNPTPWNAASTWKASGGAGGAAFARDVPLLPPLPTSKLFAPKLNPEDESSERSKALSAEEFERLRLYSQKTTHNTVAPQVCFSLAEDLRQSKGKGGRMFAKRRAKSEEWTIEGPSAPDPKMLQKIGGGFSPAEKQAPVNNATESGVEFSPVNRLKEMIEFPKAKITPWDAMAEYGNVDLAFEHLEGYSFLRPKGSPYADTVASSLQQATQRKSKFPSRPTAAQAPVQPHPSPSWNRPKELTTTNRRGNTMASPNAGFVDSSPSSYGSGSGYQPVHFQSSSGNTSTTGGFSDL